MSATSTKYIRIEGEAVSAIEEIVHKRTALPEWLAALETMSPKALTTPILPDGTALYAQKGNQQLIVINQQVAVKKVTWRTRVYRDPEQRAKNQWTLAIPPHVFLLVFERDAVHSSHIYFTPKAIVDVKDALYFTNLANVYHQSQGIPAPICAGSIRLNVKDPLAARCQQFIDHFWASEFNDDIQPQVQLSSGRCVFAGDTGPAELMNLHAWEKATTETPDFLAKMAWPFKPICTLEEILNNRWMA